MNSVIGLAGSIWGAAGVLALLMSAIARLAPRAQVAFDSGLTPSQWAITVVICIFMAVTEGYGGFQKKFSPRSAARIRYLRDRPNLLRSALAPFFVMGYFHANRKTRIIAWILPLAIVTLVILVHQLNQPWRGMLDAGVIVGLGWGSISLILSTIRALTSESYPFSPEVPES